LFRFGNSVAGRRCRGSGGSRAYAPVIEEVVLKDYGTDQIRNIALVGHGTSGKTTLVEAMLLNMKEIKRIGDITAGTTAMDYTDAERKHQFSITLGLGHGEWRETKLNLIDTPGYDDFVGDQVSGMEAADGAILVINAPAGVEAGAERAFEQAREKHLGVLIAVNMMDRENADFDKVVAEAQQFLSPKAVPLQIPIGTGPDFRGLVDLFKMKAFIYQGDGHAKEEDIPADLVGKAQSARETLIEAAADFDDAVIEKYLEGESLTDKEILSALTQGVAKAGVFPILVTSAPQNRGVRRLLDTAVVCLPSPAGRTVTTVGDDPEEFTGDPGGPLVARVFKMVIEQHVGEMSLVRVFSGTLDSASEVYNTSRNHSEKVGQINVVQGKERKEVARLVAGDIGALVKLKDTHIGDTLCLKNKQVELPPIPFPRPVAVEAVVPRNKGDEDKVGAAMHKIMEEDPTVVFEGDPELHQQLLRGMGELHFEVIQDRLKAKNIEIDLKKPRIHYRETIVKSAEAQGRYKKQTGGRGQFGDVWIKLEPMPRGGGFEFENKIVGGAVPGKFIPAVEKGLRESLQRGFLAGYPAVDMKATLYDGSFHAVDSSEMAFKVAASMAFKKLMEACGAVLLEPIMELHVYSPEEATGDVMGDLSSRRGRILGMEPSGRGQLVKALVPEGELYRYSAQLRSFTQGRGRYKMTFHAYEQIPRDSADRIIADAKAAMEEAE